MPITELVQSRTGRMQFQGLFESITEIEALYNPPSIGSNGFDQEDIEAKGAKLGDFVLLSYDRDLEDLYISCHVKTNDLLSLHLYNSTPGAVDLPEGQIHIVLLRAIHLHP